MLRDMWENFWGIFVLMPILIFGAVALGLFLNRTACLAQYESYNPQWGVFSDCRIVWEGKLTPVSMIKNINLNK